MPATFGHSSATISKGLLPKQRDVSRSDSVTSCSCRQKLKNNRLCKTDRRWISSTNQQPSRESLRRCMKVRPNRLDKPNCTTSERHRRSLLAAAAIALGGSLLLLLGAGWLQHGVPKMAISGLGALLLIGALTGIFRMLDFSTPRLVNGTPQQLAWIRILVCLTALIFTVM